MMDRILYRENEYARLWVTPECATMDRMLHEHVRDGISLEGWRTILVEPKDGECEYFLAVDSTGRPRFEATGAYDMDLKRRAYIMGLREDMDIRNIAETGNVPRMV